MTNQPTWKQIGTVGDINPFDYDGGFIYQDETGVYTEELEYIQADNDGLMDDATWNVYRWSLDRLEMVTAENGDILLVPFGFSSRNDLPHPIASYDEWFNGDIASAANSLGCTVETLRESLCSQDATRRAFAYLELAQYHGFANFDSYPYTYTDREELEARYAVRNL